MNHLHSIPGLVMWAALLLTPFTAHGHGASVWAERTDGTVVVEVFYSDARPAVAGVVKITTGDGALVAEGKTDADGRFSFKSDNRAALDVHVQLPDGHGGRAQIRAVD